MAHHWVVVSTEMLLDSVLGCVVLSAPVVSSCSVTTSGADVDPSVELDTLWASSEVPDELTVVL